MAMKMADGVEKFFIRVNLVQVYAWTNEPDLAFHELVATLEGVDSRWIESMKRHPEYDPIRNDPRFDKLEASHQ
jgi:hypothetical protein